ncbi:hypothetical protein Lalb_Chr14g0369631 [Lupinus albus]|uniref:Uncharacterized protein n=1 Tax=Lupinus albus TaxID=3870 RepID=A0A6A4PA99_LUPAL|nr:hypothetical protein Lalb_Chr14g0369631 [Lupinus albus]
MAEEGQVIGVHTVEAWKEHIEKGIETKKLGPVCLRLVFESRGIH